MRLCLNAQKCAHLMGKILLGVRSSEIGTSYDIVPITSSDCFFIIGNSFIFKDAGKL